MRKKAKLLNMLQAGFVGLGLVLTTTASGDPPAFKPVMSFADAMKAYGADTYNSDGYVGKDGKVKGGGLGCSAFVSVVLHQMRDGKDFIDKNWDWHLHQKLGQDIAAHFHLPEAGEFNATALASTGETKALLKQGKITAGKVYLFDAHPGDGHTGFVRFKDNGEIEQWHYSGMKAYNGLATGDFRAWLEGSQYSRGKFSLFELPN